MRKNYVKEKLKRGEVSFGTWLRWAICMPRACWPGWASTG